MLGKKARNAVLALCVDIMFTLGLNNWTIGISQLPPDDADDWDGGAFASIEPVPHRHVATIRVCPDFARIGHKDILLSLIHEVCHLYFVGVKQAGSDQFSIRSMSVAESNQLVARLRHEEEMAVDLMSTAWASVMADWPKVQKHLRKITPQVERTA